MFPLQISQLDISIKLDIAFQCFIKIWQHPSCLVTVYIARNYFMHFNILSGEAAGIDGISAEFYKSHPYMAAEVLQPILEEA